MTIIKKAESKNKSKFQLTVEFIKLYNETCRQYLEPPIYDIEQINDITKAELRKYIEIMKTDIKIKQLYDDIIYSARFCSYEDYQEDYDHKLAELMKFLKNKRELCNISIHYVAVCCGTEATDQAILDLESGKFNNGSISLMMRYHYALYFIKREEIGEI